MEEVTIDMPEPTTPVQEVTPPVETPVEPQIERNEKGQIVKAIAQDTNKNGTAGRPCVYCQDKEAKQKIVEDYIKLHTESVKFTVPWIEELALLLDVDDGTLVNWVNKTDDNDKREHPELLASYSKLKSLQKLRLKQRAIGRFNPHGAFYLLNADHKVVQTDRKIVTGENNEPLKIIFTEERKIESNE